MNFSVRIVDLDFYMNAPIEGLDVNYSKFRGSSINQVPILRLFGTTLEGQKICVHVHGVFPYLYIPYDGSQEANSLMYRITSLIDKSINVSLNQGTSNTQHVYKISLVSGIPMYGYHSRPHQFFKICLYNPILIKKLSNLLMNESTLGQIYQPHETHLNFTLQFMIDYNLHGMSLMNLSKIKFRRNLNQKSFGIPDDLFLPLSIRKTTVCELEADVLAHHIMNREQVTSGHIAANPGIMCLWEDEKQRRIKKGNTKKLEHPLELTRNDVEPTKSHLVFKQALRERLALFTSDQNVGNNLNSSVYPAETPENVNVQPASDNDSDITSSLELSLDDTVCDLDATLTNENSMREEDEELFNILNKLGDLSDEVEDDSILSQVVKINEEEADLDMTLPLEKSPLDIFNKSDDELDKTLIPQLDGEYDDSMDAPTEENHPSCCNSNKLIELNKAKNTVTKKHLKKGRNVNLVRKDLLETNVEPQDLISLIENRLDPICLICRERLINKKKSKKPFRRKVNYIIRNAAELKTFSIKIRKMKYNIHLCAVIKKMYEKERLILIHIRKTGHPIFRIVARSNQKDNGNIEKEREYTGHKKRRLLFIDGACDTSSEDEDCIPMTPPHVKRLSVSRNSSHQRKRRRIATMLEDDSGINISKDISLPLCDPETSHSTGFCESGISRTAPNNHSINSTVIEEKRVCAFSASSKNTEEVLNEPKSNSTHRLQCEMPSTSKNIEENFLTVNQTSSLGLSFVPNQLDREYFSSVSEEEFEPFEEFHSIQTDTNTSVMIMPEKEAPTIEEVVNSLSKYGIPHVRPQEPFYSNTQDVGGSIKLGFTVLKVNGQTTTHLQEFESQTNGLNIFRKKVIKDFQFDVPQNKSILNNIALSFCNFDTCIVKPVKEPPTPDQIEKWVKANQTKEKPKEKEHEHKTELHVPVSLGGNNDDDMDISLSLSLSEPHSSEKADETPSSSYPSSDGDDKFKDDKHTSSSSYNSYMISGVSVNDTYAFRKPTEDLKEVRVFVEHQHITVMVMELQVLTRGDFKPDPLVDPIQAIFFSIFNDVPQNNTKPAKYKGVIVVDSNDLKTDDNVPLLNGLGIACDIFYVHSEEELFKEFTNIVNLWDPDIVAGYEIEMLSWGYLIERGAVLKLNMKHNLGRNSLEEPKRRGDEYPRELKLIGRIVLDVWRLMRHEIALQSYTFESVVYNILRKRAPYYTHKTLTFWWNHNTQLYRHRVVKYYLLRVDTVLELFDKLDFINRTSELARLFGILFYEVLSRGSQFRVESMMLRLAKPLNFIPVSPSTQQRAHMKAPEYISLVLEPESKLYNDPVIVLDFQSLYPSLIIAYNYCFTTCVGRVENLGKNGPFEFGATQLKISRKRLEKMLKRDLLNFSPCGVGFVKKEVRDGIMPRMLREILDTRLMVKNSMKENKNDHNLQKVLHNRQLGLKLIANVTYGYTAANFSGRMPAVELGDSVVSKGRETLQRAIELVENTPEWEAKVVYGDTDSLFVMVPGRSREHAFEIGAKIADAVTKSNPDPVKLKLEKVYQPCILQTKKRYVGYMYESPDQKEPVYEAKGIETVRRDGIPATTKMLEKCLRILFETKDVSLVKKFVVKQFTKILTGRASIQELTFAKEYRGAAGYQPGACVPALELAKKWRAIDIRNEPRSGERVPYVIVHGPPDVPLIRLVRSPRDLLNDCFLKIHSIYYITKAIIPPINRCFNLIGVDLFTWFNEMQRKKSHYLIVPTTPDKKSTISQYFVTTSCAVCGVQTQDKICKRCNSQDQLQTTTLTLMEKLKMWEENFHNCVKICQSCTSCQDDIQCVSLDCPLLYRRVQTSHDLKQETYVRQLLPTDMSF